MKRLLFLFIILVSFMENACKPTLSRSYISFFVLLTKNNVNNALASTSTSSTTTTVPPTGTLTYPNSNYIFYLNKGIIVINPITTGAITSYSINPILPAGLIFDSITGQISGTPTVLSSIISYTVTGNFASGITTVSFSLSIVDIPPTSLTYTGSPYSFPDFIPIATIIPTISGNLTSCISNPTLPTGLSINNLCEISGTPTVAQVSASYTIIATNGGGSTSATISISVTTVNRKIYVTSAGYSPGVQFTSPATADTLCNSDAGKPAGGGTYKAMISGPTRIACLLPNCPGGGSEHTSWVFLPNTSYFQTDGVTLIGTTNANALLPSTFVNQATAHSKYWTGLNNDWTNAAMNCAGWSNTGSSTCGGQNPNNNVSNFTDIWGVVACAAAQQLLCVQQ
ncbi:MAG: DUF1554 domain-containing protein [Leptospiraceae bacterium]|nr:DUF1554 domain-containing protein [Leptospiraceae bacterium]